MRILGKASLTVHFSPFPGEGPARRTDQPRQMQYRRPDKEALCRVTRQVTPSPFSGLCMQVCVVCRARLQASEHSEVDQQNDQARTAGSTASLSQSIIRRPRHCYSIQRLPPQWTKAPRPNQITAQCPVPAHARDTTQSRWSRRRLRRRCALQLSVAAMGIPRPGDAGAINGAGSSTDTDGIIFIRGGRPSTGILTGEARRRWGAGGLQVSATV